MLRYLTRFLLTTMILTLIGFGLYDYLKNFDDNECSMTYMFQNPSLMPVKLPDLKEKRFNNYKLFLYCEGNDCPQNENMKFTKSGSIPVLFITGNADSHKQVRSFASIGIDKTRKIQKNKKIKFLYFTISFNEELSGLYGPLLSLQTEFTKHCIEHILSLFSNIKPEGKIPKSVLVIGNSMGGVVARAVMVPTNENDKFYEKNYVHTIITQSSPHKRPVINIDKPMSDIYNKINTFWLNKSETSLNNVILVSLFGGTRDIFVRTGLANIDLWKIESPATIISAHTQSMPYVWRSIDHRCMAWCRELVLVINRALFDMVDAKTEQIFENKEKRERILNHYLEHDYLKDEKSNEITKDGLEDPSLNEITDIIYKDLTPKKLEIAENTGQLNFSLNDFIYQEKVVLFNLKSHMNTEKHDSLFIYTNLNAERSFVLCKDFRTIGTYEYKCTDFKDLQENYRKTIPPLVEGRLQNSLRTLNINDLANLVNEQEYSFLLVNVPILKKTQKSHQLIIKLDWYLKNDREDSLELPSLKSNLQAVYVKNDDEVNVVFRRYYLPQFKNVLQAYKVIKVENQCDMFLSEQSLGKKNAEQKPLSLSTTMIQFHEPSQTESSNNHIFHSQAIQTKNQNISLKLSQNQLEKIPYIDIINFDIKHLLHHSSASVQNRPEKCLTNIQIEIDYISILGQIVRFFFVYTPAFIVAIIQFYDFLSLRLKLSDETFKSYFFIHKIQTFFTYHLMHSLILNLVIYILQSNGFVNFINSVDPVRNILPKNDFEVLKNEGIFHTCLGFILYWIAFSIISLASFFLSFIFNILSIIIQKFFLNFFSILENNLFQKLLGFVHLLGTICMSFFSSALAHCGLFYGELIRISAKNPIFKNPKKSSYLEFNIEQTRLLMIYLLLVLNIPSVIVWTKSLKNNEIKPFFSIMNDCGFNVAILSVILHQISYFKRVFKINIFDIRNDILGSVVLLNSVMTILYSAVNLYRLQYFILIHLFLMGFSSTIVYKNKKD